MASIFNRRGNFSASTFLKHTPLTREAQEHIQSVYGLLTCGLLISTLGVYVQSTLRHAISPGLSGLVAFGCILYILMYPDSSGKSYKRRIPVFFGLSITKGLAIAPYLNDVQVLHPGIVQSAFAATLCIFVSLSLCALFSKRREWLYLGSVISSISLYMLVATLGMLFTGSELLVDTLVLGGMVVAGLYILFDTQVIIERFMSGHRDIVTSATELYVDFIDLFLRIISALSRSERKKDKQRSKHDAQN